MAHMEGSRPGWKIMSPSTWGNPFTSDFQDPSQGTYYGDLKAVQQQIQDRAMGRGPDSPAIQLMRMNTDIAAQGAMGLARATPGVSPGLAMRRALNAQSDIMGRGTQQFGLMRSQEQMQAQQQATQIAQWQIELEKAIADGNAAATRQIIGMILAAGGAAAGYAASRPEAKPDPPAPPAAPAAPGT